MNSAAAQLAVRESPGCGRPAINMRWTHLSFLHWRLPASQVQPRVPLPLDLWNGDAWVGLVPFVMDDVRVGRLPRRFRFPETNLRTYVIGPNGEPGVWFFSLDAADRFAVIGGRTWFGLNYRLARMRCERSETRTEAQSHRISRSPSGASGFSRTVVEHVPAPARFAEPGTLEFFLLERYLLFALRRRRVLSGRVLHEPYRWRTAHAAEIEQDLSVAAGLGELSRPPDHCAAADDVRVVGLAPVPAA